MSTSAIASEPLSLPLPLRPILHHLNADTSWLLQLPHPESLKVRGRLLFNILIDPWFDGPQSDVAAWFSTQRHAIPSAVKSVAETEDLASVYENIAASTDAKGNSSPEDANRSMIDVVVISHEFTDHCHKDTLLELHPTVPVFAPKIAANMIRGWEHFETVTELPAFISDGWRGSSTPQVPNWLSLARIEDENDSLYYHSAVMIAFGPENASECVIYTPHGVAPTALSKLHDASPSIETLCFIHGLHDVRLYGMTQLNLGGHNGLKGHRVLKPKYWIATHDEVKEGGGIVAYFLRREIISLDQALKTEGGEYKVEKEEYANLTDIKFEEVGNGETRILA
jgi:hypothetical protein